MITRRHENDGSVSVQQTNGVFVSNYIPLWVGLAPADSPEAMAALHAFKASVSVQLSLGRPETVLHSRVVLPHTFWREA